MAGRGVEGDTQIFWPPPSAAQRREWLEEAELRAEVEQELRTRSEAVPPAPEDDVKVLSGLCVPGVVRGASRSGT